MRVDRDARARPSPDTIHLEFADSRPPPAPADVSGGRCTGGVAVHHEDPAWWRRRALTSARRSRPADTGLSSSSDRSGRARRAAGAATPRWARRRSSNRPSWVTSSGQGCRDQLLEPAAWLNTTFEPAARSSPSFPAPHPCGRLKRLLVSQHPATKFSVPQDLPRVRQEPGDSY